MATGGQTEKLGLNKWGPKDPLFYQEWNENFQKIDDGHKQVAEQLEDIVTDVKKFGAKGDAVSDDSDALVLANGEGRILHFPKGHYKINSIPTNTKIQGITGAGIGKTIIEFADNNQLLIDNGFLLSGVSIVSNSAKLSTESTKPLLFSSVSVGSCLFENIDYRTNASESGDMRGSSLVEGYINNSTFRNIKINGVRVGFAIYGSGIANNKFSDITFYNAQTGFYISNKKSNFTQIVESDMFRGLQFNNITLINTLEQQGFFTQINGSDLFMFEQVKDAILSNVHCERAVERAGYFNCCQGINLSNYINKDCQGYHFVGYINLGTNVINIGKDFKASNGLMLRGVNKDVDHDFMFYDCEDIVVENIKSRGSENESVITSNCFLTAHAYVKNLVLKNIEAKYYNRNFLQFTNEFVIQTDILGNNWTRKTEMRNIVIENCITRDTNLGQFAYPAIRFSVSQSVIDNIGTGNYVFNNIHIKNNIIKQAVANPTGLGYQSGEKMRGIVGANSVNGLFISNNEINGHSEKDAIEVGSLSKNIIVEIKTIQQNENMVLPLNAYISQNSKLIRKFTTGKINFTQEITPLRKVEVTQDATKLVTQQCSVNVSGDILLNPSESFRLFNIDSYYKHAELNLIKQSHGDRSNFIHKHVLGTIVMNGDSIFSNSDVVDKICFYRDASGLSIKNNTIYSISLIISGIAIYDNTPRYY